MVPASFVSSFVVGPNYLRTPPVALAQQRGIELDVTLDDAKVSALFAWVSRAFAGDERYNNLVLAIVAVFGNLPADSDPMLLLEAAKELAPAEEDTVGEPFSLRERESHSLGAMGAAQWTGQWRTRPHALLDVRPFADDAEWVKTLPRGARRTLTKATQQNYTVACKPIVGGKPAPHSTLAHFRCVVDHEVRLLADGGNGFVDAIGEAVGRYMGTTRMAGEIREYRDAKSGKVIALAHEVRKGRVVRGQWFYGTDEASKAYVWFHSVQSLVARAIANEDVDVVDLGPSGSDAFSDLKARYGFASVEDWPSVADYQGPFVYDAEDTTEEERTLLDMFGIKRD